MNNINKFLINFKILKSVSKVFNDIKKEEGLRKKDEFKKKIRDGEITFNKDKGIFFPLLIIKYKDKEYSTGVSIDELKDVFGNEPHFIPIKENILDECNYDYKGIYLQYFEKALEGGEFDE